MNFEEINNLAAEYVQRTEAILDAFDGLEDALRKRAVEEARIAVVREIRATARVVRRIAGEHYVDPDRSTWILELRQDSGGHRFFVEDMPADEKDAVLIAREIGTNESIHVPIEVFFDILDELEARTTSGEFDDRLEEKTHNLIFEEMEEYLMGTVDEDRSR